MSYEEENVKKLCLKIQLPLITKSFHTELCVMCIPIILEWKRLRKGDCKLCPNMGHIARDRNKNQIWTSAVAEQIKALAIRPNGLSSVSDTHMVKRRAVTPGNYPLIFTGMLWQEYTHTSE